MVWGCRPDGLVLQRWDETLIGQEQPHANITGEKEKRGVCRSAVLWLEFASEPSGSLINTGVPEPTFRVDDRVGLELV